MPPWGKLGVEVDRRPAAALKSTPHPKAPGLSAGGWQGYTAMCEKLPLDTAGAVAAGELLDLGDGDHVVVAFDRVLERRH